MAVCDGIWYLAIVLYIEDFYLSFLCYKIVVYYYRLLPSSTIIPITSKKDILQHQDGQVKLYTSGHNNHCCQPGTEKLWEIDLRLLPMIPK
jgi:hypothetical protein